MRVRAQELADVDVPGLGVGVVPGEGEGVAGVLRLQDHVVAGVGAADHRRTGALILRSEPGLDTAPPAVGVSVPGVGRARPGDYELGKV